MALSVGAPALVIPRVALVVPPTCDPTAPQLAVPALAGFLRERGVVVAPIDANVEAWDALLEPGSLVAVQERLERRLAELDARASLDHAAQLEYAALWRARGDAQAAPEGIARAKGVLRDPTSFYDPAAYGPAVATVDAALRAISAAYAPLHVDFTAYRTPFALTTPEEIARDAEPERDPFDGYVVGTLLPRLRAEAPGVVGLSVAFPGQLQPAFAFAQKIKRALPDAHLTIGGPAITQLLVRLRGTALARALGPFDSAVLFEGEHTLLALVEALGAGGDLRALTNVVLRDRLQGARWLAAHASEDLRELPAPDFDGLPLDKYLSPALTLPYDPTRGCYWGKCTFCHYGLAEVGTAKYRERDVGQMVAHLRRLSTKHGTRHFYFSQDSVAPKTLVKLAEGLVAEGLDLSWGTDLKPERYLTEERAETLRRAGAVACALGVESASPRVLERIDKGAPIEVVRDVARRLASAGVAPEAMCFTDFPTETADEALQTIAWIDGAKDDLGLFILGEFGLTHGALIAQRPEEFGIAETWALDGDELGTGLFFAEAAPGKTDAERGEIERALALVSSKWWLRRYPWAGAVSTAHTLLYYARFGRGVFRELARAGERRGLPVYGFRALSAEARFDPSRAEEAEAHERRIWDALSRVERRVSREAYAAHAARVSPLEPSPCRVRYAAGQGLSIALGRRPRTTPNALA